MERSYIMSKVPKSVGLELVRGCNLRCNMCPVSKPNFNDGKITYMSWDVIKKMVPFLKKAQNLGLHGLGEPLLHPDIISIIKFIKKECPHLSFGFSSNSALLTDDTIRQLVKAGLPFIFISYDGRNIPRGHPNPDKVIDTIRRIQKLKKEVRSPYPFVSVATTVGRDNIDQYGDIVDVVKSLGMKYVYVGGLRRLLPEQENDFFKENSAVYNKELMMPIHDEVNCQAAKDGIRISESCMGTLFETRTKCDCPNEDFIVNADGSIVACRFLYPTVQNILDHDPFDFWNGDFYQSLRKDLDNHIYKGFCLKCVLQEDRVQNRSYLEERLTQDELLEYERLFEAGEFNEFFYRTHYQDVKESGMNPVVHYMKIGRKEKRKVVPCS